MSQQSAQTHPLPVDPVQLNRIEAVHRGFLFQHLYAARSLLLAAGTDIHSVVIEGDEDVEIVRAGRRTYVQVKLRSNPLGFGEIEGALERFEGYRALHALGERPGEAVFVIATNADLRPDLAARLDGKGWPRDVRIDHPRAVALADPVTPLPATTLAHAFLACRDLAASLPFATLAPETLVWKLAGLVMLAASGTAPRADHAFQACELPALFEQLVVQLQDLPAPPALYRPQVDEPPLVTDARIRLITGHSGAGKTSWVSQSAVHAPGTILYFDTRDIPGPALAASLARELAARLFGSSDGGLGEILLPGASGAEILQVINRRTASESLTVTVVVDNVQSPPAADVRALIRAAPALRFVLLGQPAPNVQELSALLAVPLEALGGWSPDTIAAEAAAEGCRLDAAASQALLGLTGGLPLYVQNAVTLAATEHAGSIADLCAALAARTHSVETAQELILTRLLETLPNETRSAVAVLGLSDVPLARTEVDELLRTVSGADAATTASHLRRLRSIGVLEMYGGDRLKVHDALRLSAYGQLSSLGSEFAGVARRGLRDVLFTSFATRWEHRRLGLYLRMLAETGDVKTLVEAGGEEMFHELGIWPEIKAYLEAAASSDDTDPEDRFWALDGIVFNDMRVDDSSGTMSKIELMNRLVADHGLGLRERMAVGMKEMNLLARDGDEEGVFRLMETVAENLDPSPEYQRIFRYNAAAAVHHLGYYAAAASQALEIASEYYELLGLTPEMVVGRNASDLRALVRQTDNLPDDLKHLADCLDLHVKAIEATGRDTPFARIQALKFYQLAQAPESMFRVGLDLAGSFVQRNDFVGARQVLENSLIPELQNLKLAAYNIPIRSYYAVVLAYCGEFDAADAEMARLAPYELGLTPMGQEELRSQRRLIADLRRHGPPPQTIISQHAPRTPEELRRMIDSGDFEGMRHRATDQPGAGYGSAPRKVGRNEPCPCGSGKKFKKCHG